MPTRSTRFLSVIARLVCALCALSLSAHGQVLFDNTKAETAGNADWIIDTTQPVPSPSITGITASSSESYWTGALSSWGVALAKLRNANQISLSGNGLETLPATGAITYGDAANPQDLSHYQVYVVCEPNILFTATEKTAILNFVQNGGGLFMVADHTSSDRNNDGKDSLQVWNDLMTNNTVQTNPFGFLFNSANVSPSSPTADGSTSNPLTHGLAGTVTTLAYSSGTTMTINNSLTTTAAVWSASSTTGVMALYGTFGAGRFAAIGDSSVVEDVTSSSGTTFAGWTTPADNGYCALNGTLWLLKAGSNTLTTPTVTTGTATGVSTTTATLSGTVNPNGQSATAQFQYGLTASYGSTAAVSGSLTGTSNQAVSVNITSLAPGTTYHFRVSATNASGASFGLDQSFTTAASAVVDLAITKTHTGNFTQGETGDTYTITVTNIGGLASSGAVSVVDTLPAGLTATAISGSGWTTNLGTLTATRSDVLAAGAGYPPITLVVNVATNAPASMINTATVSGGGDANLANNTVNDPTTINPSGGGGGTNYTGMLAGWDVSGQTAFGVSPLAPATNAPNLTVVGLTRGSGVGTAGTAATKAWGGTGFNDATATAAINANHLATFSVTANAGYKVSLAALNRFDYRRSSSGPPNGVLQYQLGAGGFVDLTNLSFSVSTSSGGSLGPIDLSGIAALQNVSAGTTITFRIVSYGASASGGTWYVWDLASSTAPDLALQGTIAPVNAAGDLALSLAHAGNFTQGDGADAYTLMVTNSGAAASSGTVTVTDALPAGLTATAISGSGWSATLNPLSCTRSDALAAGASYPPITITVSVAANAPASVTNTASVSGGGDANLANNTASDPTIIIALTPSQAWRLRWFGTTNSSGSAADMAIAAGDGMPNLLKYALGLNPLIPAASPVAGDISTGHLRLTTPKNPDATDITLLVEVAGDLAALWTTNGTTLDQNTPALLQVHANAPVSATDSGYIRLHVTRP
jgi:uncharacterized repeat protein (TIGR01451 family)